MGVRTRFQLVGVDQVRAHHGGHWFDRDTMRFFGTRIGACMPDLRRGRLLFVTSEVPPRGVRRYSVRAATWTRRGDGWWHTTVDTVGAFCGYATRAQAVAAMKAEVRAC